MSKTLFILFAFAMLLIGTRAQADNFFHKPPHDYLFGNHIDTHQETKLTLDNHTGMPKELRGMFYVILTEAFDPVSGLPVARHPRGLANDGSHDERCGITVQCVVGWEMRGVPGAAKFVSHSGVNGDDHPLWLVNRAEGSAAPAPGMAIPQPGHFSHFHWITRSSTDPRASLVSAACDKMNAGDLETAAPIAVNVVCQGWFLQITARKSFAFEHGGELIPVTHGADLGSHLNIITNYKSPTAVPVTRTRD